jgi:hypothetical protein
MVLTEDIVAQLVTGAVGVAGHIVGTTVTPSTGTIFENTLPALPDDCIAVFAYGGIPPSVDWEGEFPNIQVRVRATSHDTAYDNAYHVMHTLHKLTRTTINGTIYYWIAAKQSPSSLGRDAKGRHIYVINFDVIKEME